MKVLIVEDNEDQAELLRLMLSDGRFECQKCATLLDGLATMKTWQPDVVLLDLYLPDSKGGQTYRTVAGAEPDTPIVVVTGMDADFVQEAAPGEAEFVLDKTDTSQKELMAALILAVEKRRAKPMHDEVTQALTDTGNAAKEIKKTLDEAKP